MVLGVEQARGQGADVRQVRAIRARPPARPRRRWPCRGCRRCRRRTGRPVRRRPRALGLGEGAGDGRPVGVRARVQPAQRGGPGDQGLVGGHRVGGEQVVGDPGRRAEVLHHHERRVGGHPEQTGRHADRPGGGQTHASRAHESRLPPTQRDFTTTVPASSAAQCTPERSLPPSPAESRNSRPRTDDAAATTSWLAEQPRGPPSRRAGRRRSGARSPGVGRGPHGAVAGADVDAALA